MKKLLLLCLSIAGALAIHLYAERAEDVRRDASFHESLALIAEPLVKPYEIRVEQTSSGPLYRAYYRIIAGPRRSGNGRGTGIPRCAPVEPSDDRIDAFTIIGVGLASLAHASGKTGEALHPILEEGAKAAAPLLARSIPEQTVASCHPLRFMVPAALNDRQLVDSHVSTRRIGSDAAIECIPAHQQRECLAHGSVWLFQIDRVQLFNPSLDAASKLGSLAGIRPTLVNWSTDPVEGTLELDFK